MLFAIAALRAIIEMLGLCLLAQATLYLLAGRRRDGNPIYRLFALVTHFPRRAVAILLPKNAPGWLAGMILFLLLFVLWIGLALARTFV